MLARSIFMLVAMALVTACGGQVVKNENLRDIDPATFDGAFISYFLPRGELTMKVDYDASKQIITVTRDLKIYPDVSHHYHAVYHHNDFSNDTVTLQIDPNGLLKQVSTTTTDQTTAIIKAVGDVAQEFGPFRTATAGPKVSAAPPKKEQEPPACPNLSVQAIPDITYWDKKKQRPAKITDTKSGCTLELNIDDVVRATPLDAVAYPAAAPEAPYETKPCPTSAVCFRAASGYKVTFSGKLTRPSSKPIPIDQTTVSTVAPDRFRTGVLYFNRRAFVENSTTAEFTDGMLTKLTVKDPSAIAGALALPAQILKSLTILVRL
jgi:hypothetical protein